MSHQEQVVKDEKMSAKFHSLLVWVVLGILFVFLMLIIFRISEINNHLQNIDLAISETLVIGDLETFKDSIIGTKDKDITVQT